MLLRAAATSMLWSGFRINRIKGIKCAGWDSVLVLTAGLVQRNVNCFSCKHVIVVLRHQCLWHELLQQELCRACWVSFKDSAVIPFVLMLCMGIHVLCTSHKQSCTGLLALCSALSH